MFDVLRRNAEQFNPEKQCAAPTALARTPTATRSPSPTAAPTSGAPRARPRRRAGERLALAELRRHGPPDARPGQGRGRARAAPAGRAAPDIGINDVLIRVHKTGICGTDLHIESWDPWAAKTIKPPLVVGHEFVGEIVEVGSNVTDFHPGDLVSGEGHVTCGRCRHCLAGQRHLCANTVGLGVGRDGAFAEYVALPMTNIWHHWPGIDEEVAAIFDPFGNAVHTALAFPVLGEDVLVSGAGPIGLMATAVVAMPVRATSWSPSRTRSAATSRCGWARPCGRPARARPARRPGELGMVEGFDVALEMSGNAGALRTAIENMAHGGRIAILGIPTGEITLDVNAIVFNQLTLRGHLRPRDVRDLVQDAGPAPVGPRHHARRSPTGSASATSRPPSPRRAPAIRAR